MDKRFEIVIIGAGPAGLAAGVQAAKRGVSHALLERAELANTIARYQKGKLVMAEPTRLPLQEDLALPFDEGTREQVLEAWQRGVQAGGVNVLQGPEYEVTSVRGAKGDFTLTLKGGETITAAIVILAIGEQGNLRTFGVSGDDLPFVTYQLDDPLDHEDQDVVVVGAGDAGIENALALAECANSVTIVNRNAEFDRAKTRNRDLITAAIKAGTVRHAENASVDRFAPGVIHLRRRAGKKGGATGGTIQLRTEGGTIELQADVVIGRLGAIPPRRFLTEAGIDVPEERGTYPEISETYESNVPGIYLVGALTGYPLIKNCMNQGFEAVEHALGHRVAPADEPLLREVLAPLGTSVASALQMIRETIPLFSGLTTVQLREFLVDSEIVTPQPGETIFERNDYSDELYSILAGDVEFAIPVSDAEAASDRAEGTEQIRTIRCQRGEFFGEGSMISGRRRSATVKAVAPAREPCALLKTKRLAMTKLAKQVPSVRRTLDHAFLVRRLRSYIDDAAEFGAEPHVVGVTIQRLAESGIVRKFQQDELLWEEGAPSDGLHYLRRGSVTISRRSGGTDLVVNSVEAGNYIGERAPIDPNGRRSASARAAVFVETVCLPTEAIEAFLTAYPSVRERFERMDVAYSESDAARMLNRRGNDLASFLMAQGAGEATDLLLIDESLCVRCDNCETACAQTHAGVSRLDREAGPTFGTIHIPISCRHCENPKCLTDCPPDAIRREPSGEVFIMDNCIGCGNCATNCPYDVIQMAAVSQEKPPSILSRILFGTRSRAVVDGPKHAVKCDLCRNLHLRPRPDGGHGSACVASCPTGAIVRVDPHRYLDRVLRGSESPL